MYLVSPENLGHIGKLPPPPLHDRRPPRKRGGTKKNSPHNKWLRVRKQMDEEKVLNAALFKKSPNFYEKY
jgi:hypothetical protein